MKADTPKEFQHCCPDLARAAAFDCDVHADAFECPDTLIYYSKKRKKYGIIFHDGGSSYSVINFCPWCGAQLPEAKED